MTNRLKNKLESKFKNKNLRSYIGSYGIEVFLIISMLVAFLFIQSCDNTENRKTITKQPLKEITQINTEAINLKESNYMDRTYFIVEVKNTICPDKRFNNLNSNNKNYTEIDVIGKGIVFNSEINGADNAETNAFVECSYNHTSNLGISLVFIETKAAVNAGPISIIIDNNQVVTYNNYKFVTPSIITDSSNNEIGNIIRIPVGNIEAGFNNEMTLFLKPRNVEMYKRKTLSKGDSIRFEGYEKINITQTINELNTKFLNYNTLDLKGVNNYNEDIYYKVTGLNEYNSQNAVNCFQNKEVIEGKTCGIKIYGTSKNNEILNISYNKEDAVATPENIQIIVERNLLNKYKVTPRHKRIPELKSNSYVLIDISTYNEDEIINKDNLDYKLLFNNNNSLTPSIDYFKVESINNININKNMDSVVIDYQKLFNHLYVKNMKNKNYGEVLNFLNFKILETKNNSNIDNSLSENKMLNKYNFEIMPIRYMEINNTPVISSDFINNSLYNNIIELENNKAYNLILRKTSFGNALIYKEKEDFKPASFNESNILDEAKNQSENLEDFRVSNSQSLKKIRLVSEEIDYRINYDGITFSKNILLENSSSFYQGIPNCKKDSSGDCFITINTNKSNLKENSRLEDVFEFESITIPFNNNSSFKDLNLKIRIVERM